MALFPEETEEQGAPLVDVERVQLFPEAGVADVESDEYNKQVAFMAAAAQDGALLPENLSRIELLQNQVLEAIRAKGDERIREIEREKESRAFLAHLNAKLEEEVRQGALPEALARSAVELQKTQELLRQQRDDKALERNFITKVQAMKAQDPTRSFLELENEIRGEAFDQLNDRLTMDAIIANEVAKKQFLQSDRNFLFDLADGLGLAFAFGTGQDLSESSGVEGSFFNPGGSLEEQVMAIRDTPLQQFVDKFPNITLESTKKSGIISDNLLQDMATIEALEGMARGKAAEMNFWAGLDIATLIPIGATAKLGSKAAEVLRLTGQSRALAVPMARTLTGDASHIVAQQAGKEALDEATVAAIPGLKSTVLPVTSPDQAKHIQDILTAQDEVIEEAKRMATLTLPRLTKEETEVAFKRAKERAALENPGNQVSDYTSLIETTPDQPTMIRLWLGSKKTGSYSKEADAKAAIKRKGMDGKGFVATEKDGKWYITAEKAIDESGVVIIHDLKELEKTSYVRSLLAGNRGLLGEELYGRAVWSVLNQSGFYERVFKPLEKQLAGFSKKNRESLSKVVNSGKLDGVWFNQDDFTAEYMRLNGRAPRFKDFVAYEAMRKATDIESFVRNQVERTTLAGRGVKHIEINKKLAGSLNPPDVDTIEGVLLDTPMGRELVTPDEIGAIPVNEMRLFNVTTQKTIHPTTITNDTLREMVEKQGYRIVELEGAHRFHNTGGEVKYIIGKRNDIGVRELPARVMGERAGGHLEYAVNYLIKQTRTGKYSDGLQESFIKSPGVWMGGRSAKQLQPILDEMNEVLSTYKSMIAGKATVAEFETVLTKSVWENVDAAGFQKMVDDGLIDLNHKFEITFDRELPRSTRELMAGGTRHANLGADPVHSARSYYENAGRMYYSRRGDTPLLGPDGQIAEMLDPFKTTAKALANVNKLGAMTNFKLSEVERWAKAAEKYFEPGQRFAQGGTSMDKFLNGVLRKIDIRESDSATINALEILRTKIKDILKTKSPSQARYEAQMRRLAEHFDEKGMDRLRDVAFDLKDANPLRALKAFNFDLKMGFFSPAQLFIQAQTAFAATAIHPVLGVKAMQRSGFMLRANINGTDNFLDHLAKEYKTLHGMDPDEFKAMTRAMRDSGFDKPGNEMQLYEGFSNAIGDGAVVATYKQIREMGRFFPLFAERWNRTVAWSMSWDLAKQRGLDMTTRETLQAVKVRADDLTFNMTTAGASWWQKGVLGIPTQFLSFQGRMLEAMMPVVMGGSKAFTTAEKIRLIAGQFALYGTAGIPMGDWIARQYREHTGSEINAEIYDGITRGFWDNMFEGLTGAQVDVRHRAGTGAGLEQLWRKLTGDFGDASFLEILAGPAGGSLGGILESVQDVSRIVTLGMTDSRINFTPRVFERIAQNMSSFNDIQKAYMIYNLGQVLNRQGDVLQNVEANKGAYAALMLLGAKPEVNYQASELYHENSKAGEELRSQLRRVILPSVQSALQSGNPAEVEEAVNYLNAMSNMINTTEIEKRNFNRAIMNDLKVRQVIPFALQKRLDRTGHTPYTEYLIQQEMNRNK